MARARTVRAMSPALAVLAMLAGGTTAVAEPPPLSLRAQETTDFWRNTTGGKSVGDALLAKLDLQADWSGAAGGHPDWSARARVIATNSDFFSGRRVGDLQTLSNIEGDGYLHAFEIWAQKSWGGKASVRAGFLDLNADFDSIQTAGLFLNSSHGIGPDLSESAVVGPSIFPVTALGARAQWTPDKRWTLNLGVYDGVPGSPHDPGAFAATDLSSHDGATLIGEVDRGWGRSGRIGVGVWGYTARFPLIGAPLASQRGQAGIYGFIEGPVPGLDGLSGWVRLGRADGDVNVISGYEGAGLTLGGAFLGRAHDRLGLAVARAEIGAPAQAAHGLRGAETSIEATYQAQPARWLSIQPDVQYVIDPGGRYRDALAIGLRIVLSAQGPDWRAGESDPPPP